MRLLDLGGTLCLALCLAACQSSTPRPPTSHFEGEAPGQIRPPEVLGLDVVWRQRVTASWRDEQGDAGSRGFEAVLQKRGAQLTVLSLSPMGSAGFVIQLEGEQIELRNDSAEPLPFPPRFVLLDIQRVFYPWVTGGAVGARVPAGAPLPDGEHVAELFGEQVTEVWAGGRLQERRFRRLDDQPPGDVVVTYSWGADDSRSAWKAPTRAVLSNHWFGYELDIDTLDETLLDPGE